MGLEKYESRQNGNLKQEMEHLNVAVLDVSELKWTRMGHFQSQLQNILLWK